MPTLCGTFALVVRRGHVYMTKERGYRTGEVMTSKKVSSRAFSAYLIPRWLVSTEGKTCSSISDFHQLSPKIEISAVM